MPAPDSMLAAAADHHRAGRLDQAEATLRRAVRSGPGRAEASRMLAVILSMQGKHDQAVFFARQAASASPASAAMLATLGVVLGQADRTDEAVRTLQRAIDADPACAPALGELGSLLAMQRRFDEAMEVMARAVRAAPADPVLRANFGTLHLDLNRADEAVAILQDALREHPDHPGLLSALCAATNYSSAVTPAESFDLHTRYGRLLAAGPHAPHPNSPDPHRRLRLAYLSPDLCEHSVAYFLFPLLAHHDRNAFEVVGLSASAREDAVTQRLRASCDGWIAVAAFRESALLELLRRERFDIIVELAGLTARSRLAVLRHHPAPVQVTAIGYPNTTGLSAIDYRLVDEVTDPPGSERLAVETLARVPGCFLCYQPPDDAPDPVPPPSQAAGHVTFGSFNAIKKLTPQAAAVWSALLRRVEGSRLVLKGAGLGGRAARERVAGLFAAHGLDPSRVELLDMTIGRTEHLAGYARVDVALDTFPYNGTTTTCEALWMGVPVVALRGSAHASRVGASLLAAAGVPELVADDSAGYGELAASLAGDAGRLGELRATLRRRVAASTLCDGPGYARRVESLYRDMWRRWCAART
jgi:protein O-GlcNAc transferase